MNTGREQLEEHLQRQAELRERPQLKRAWEHARRHPLLTAVVALVLISTFLSAISSLASYKAQRDAEDTSHRLNVFIQASLHDSCESLNKNREDSRQLMRRGDIESGEALIEAITVDSVPDPQLQIVIDRYRDILAQRQANIVEEHTADDIDCDVVAPKPGE